MTIALWSLGTFLLQFDKFDIDLGTFLFKPPHVFPDTLHAACLPNMSCTGQHNGEGCTW